MNNSKADEWEERMERTLEIAYRSLPSWQRTIIRLCGKERIKNMLKKQWK